MKTDMPAPGVHRLLTMMVNVYFVSDEAGGWTLVDAGLRPYTSTIRSAAHEIFGSRPPSAIVLTHGHFDHVGALPDLARAWDVPVYAHPLELPYLSGRSSYPPPDPTVGGGMMSLLSPLYPRGPINLGSRLRPLPADESVPALPGWRWIHTPGHTAGHVSLFRDADRLLLAGDAVVTTKQESTIDVVRQREVVWRPPAYYTSDWDAAHASIERLAALEPGVLATGHGRVLRGPHMRRALHQLADDFDRVRPAHGRYADHPAVADGRGIVSVPPPAALLTPAALAGAATAVGVAAALVAIRSHRRNVVRSS